MPEITKEVPLLKCARCRHEWQQRGKEKPGQCPKCRSAIWDRPAKRARSK